VSRHSPFEVQLCGVERAVLEQRASSRSLPHSQVVRARIVLLAAEGAQNLDIARRVGVCVDVASRRRKRFCLAIERRRRAISMAAEAALRSADRGPESLQK